MSNKPTTTIEVRLGVIETDIGYLTKSMDMLISKLPDFYEIGTSQRDLEKRVFDLENKNTKKDLLVWGALISANILMAIKIVFL